MRNDGKDRAPCKVGWVPGVNFWLFPRISIFLGHPELYVSYVEVRVGCMFQDRDTSFQNKNWEKLKIENANMQDDAVPPMKEAREYVVLYRQIR
jgi:hypothetical protein